MSNHLQMQKSPAYSPDDDYKQIIAALVVQDYEQFIQRRSQPRLPTVNYTPTIALQPMLFPLWKHMERQAGQAIVSLRLGSKQGQTLFIDRPKRLKAYAAPNKSTAIRKEPSG